MAKKTYSLYKRGSIWWYGVMEDGKQKCYSTRTKRRELAERVAETWVDNSAKVTVEDILAHYIDEDPNRSDETIKYANYFFRRFTLLLLDKRAMIRPAAMITKERVKYYQDHLMHQRELNPTSIKIEFGGIKSLN